MLNKKTDNRCVTFYKNEWEIREIRYSPKGRGNKGIISIKTNGNRYVIFNKNERKIREVVFTKTKGK